MQVTMIIYFCFHRRRVGQIARIKKLMILSRARPDLQAHWIKQDLIISVDYKEKFQRYDEFTLPSVIVHLLCK